MSDLLQIVTRSIGGRPVLVKDLDDGDGYTRVRDSFKYTPGAPKQQVSQSGRRFGGGAVVAETHENAQVSWVAMVRGTSPDQAAQRVEQLLAEVSVAARGRLIRWRPDGNTYSSYLRLCGPGQWDPSYQWVLWQGSMVLLTTVTFPCFPLVEWDQMRIADDFSVDSVSDYTFDALTASSVTVAGGSLTPNGSLTSERRARHTVRGYKTLGGQRTQKFTPVTTITGFKGGVTLRGSAANTYVEVYVDDNGTNSRLRIDVVIAGTVTNRQTTNLAARITTGTAFWVRGRIEGNLVIAEYFLAAPTPMGAPTLAPAGYTLTAGEQTSLVAGYSGFTWVPQNAGATMDDFAFAPIVRRNVTLPEELFLDDAVPGRAPALADVTVTPSGGTAAPVFALLAWTGRPSAPVAGAVAPFGILEAETAGDLTGWASAVNAGSRGGNRLIDAAVSGAETYAASWTIDPSTLVADDFTAGELLLELWALVVVSSTLVSPKLTASIRPVDGLNFGAERPTLEWGSTGRLLTVPSSGEKRRMMRLGTLLLGVDPLAPRAVKLWVTGSTAIGSTGTFGIDYLMPVLARSRALSPTGEPLDSAYPKFVASTSETSKTIRSDLSAVVAAPPNNPYPDHGLGGNLLELPNGPVDMLVKLSSLVPDDPTVDATDEQLAHTATVTVCPTPRSFLLRDA